MGHVGQSVERGVVQKDRHVVFVDANVMRDLVVCPLHEGRVCDHKRFRSALRQPGSHRDGLFFGNAYVDELRAERFSVFGGKPHAAGHVRCYRNEFFILFCFA